MAHYGMLREYKFEGELNDLRGSEVFGVNNEQLGKIDDVIFDHSSGDIRYIVLKTGGLLSRKRVMVPVGRIQPYGNHEDKFYAELDKERLEMLPEFKEETLKSESNWAAHEKEHEKRWNDGAVLYNKDTGRIITPPQEEVMPATGGRRPATTGRPLDLKPEKMGKQDDYLGVASGTGKTTLQPKKPSIGGKEDVELMQQRPVREVMNPVGGELEIPIEGDIPIEGSNQEGVAEQNIDEPNIDEPAIYRLDPVIETEQGRGPDETQELYRGRRWNEFQQRLYSRRGKIVVDCPQCGSQDKAA
jgi:sporulation protein YlmC with PRC-barrel domain